MKFIPATLGFLFISTQAAVIPVDNETLTNRLERQNGSDSSRSDDKSDMLLKPLALVTTNGLRSIVGFALAEAHTLLAAQSTADSLRPVIGQQLIN
ncbi:hypothetical protein DSO57_1037011 [Entomophthora muscae]|uniref:Uncharacterized protein n=1 Tax=Entomophthora muscae TaxID=34485 RepID=A0ACC2S189_9FUNG|nr:hypothetical protein DSO57_1037011 [Entomophthora muscae]